MNLTDPIGDMLTRIRNAIQARHDSVVVPVSREKMAIARVLKEEGFIRDFEMVREKNVQVSRMMRIHLKYVGKRESVVTGLKRVSKPGLRVYSGAKEIPRLRSGLGPGGDVHPVRCDERPQGPTAERGRRGTLLHLVAISQ